MKEDTEDLCYDAKVEAGCAGEEKTEEKKD